MGKPYWISKVSLCGADTTCHQVNFLALIILFGNENGKVLRESGILLGLKTWKRENSWGNLESWCSWKLFNKWKRREQAYACLSPQLWTTKAYALYVLLNICHRWGERGSLRSSSVQMEVWALTNHCYDSWSTVISCLKFTHIICTGVYRHGTLFINNGQHGTFPYDIYATRTSVTKLFAQVPFSML